MRLDRERSLCPVCGQRPVRSARSGFCLVCHRRALTEKHLELLQELDAKRACDAGKQILHRARERYAAAAG
jgi:RNA polymerase subunit RPABC4/transcription elongation factor Spt4